MEFLMIGTFWFWLLLTLAAGFIIFAIEVKESGTAATITLALTIGLLYLFGPRHELTNLFLFIVHNPLLIVIIFIGYIFAGTVWSIVKWWFFLKDEWRDAKKRVSEGYYFKRPKASEEKGRIMSWMFYWPFSGLWTLINDPVKRAFKSIYDFLENTYEKMSARVFKDLEEEQASRAKK